MEFTEYLKQCSNRVDTYFSSLGKYPLEPDELEEGTFCYFKRGGKRLRPAILSLCAGALGGAEKENAAVPCAAGLEFYHNYTLIHDDIIDKDATRRGKMSTHTLICESSKEKYGSNAEKSAEYGTDAAILCGDALHSIAIDSITRLSENSVSPRTVIKIISLLEGNYGIRLISGETIDTRNGIIYDKGDIDKITEKEIIAMMSGKTGALFSVCAVAGALIGLDSDDESDERVSALSSFANDCGIAFQLKDDILGITSTVQTLGKPILSDIREGKATVLLLHSYNNANEEEKAFLKYVFENEVGESELLKARDIIIARGGIEYTTKLGKEYLGKAKESLYKIEKNEYRDLLEAWCDFMIERKL